MNLLSSLSGFRDRIAPVDEPKAYDQLSPEEREEFDAEQKSKRIQFHRDHVRNGPRNFGHVTNGQQRRFGARQKASANRKMNRRNRSSFKDKQVTAAVLRGQLQSVGALAYETEGFEPTTAARAAAAVWIVHRFADRYEKDVSNADGFHAAGDLVLHDDVLIDSIGAALKHYVALTS